MTLCHYLLQYYYAFTTLSHLCDRQKGMGGKAVLISIIQIHSLFHLLLNFCKVSFKSIHVLSLHDKQNLLYSVNVCFKITFCFCRWRNTA